MPPLTKLPTTKLRSHILPFAHSYILTSGITSRSASAPRPASGLLSGLCARKGVPGMRDVNNLRPREIKSVHQKLIGVVGLLGLADKRLAGQ
jgi:hypothetical protein